MIFRHAYDLLVCANTETQIVIRYANSQAQLKLSRPLQLVWVLAFNAEQGSSKLA